MIDVFLAVGIFLGICLGLFLLFAFSVNYVFDRGTQEATHKFLAWLGGFSAVAWIIYGIYRLVS